MATAVAFNDPMYIHPSDTLGMNLVNETLVGTENYGIWSRAMLIALRAKNKTALSMVLALDQRLVMLHCFTGKDEIFGGIVYSTDASVVWIDLKEQFDKVNGSRIFLLHREIGQLKQGNSTISTYFCKLKQLWDEYYSLVVLPSCECAAARQYVDHEQRQKLLQFLMGLNESYSHIRSQILMMSPLPINKVHHLRKDVLRCDHCNWNGHTKETCYKLVGYSPDHKLYKPQVKGPIKKVYKPPRPPAHVNTSEADQRAFTPDGNVTGISPTISVFTPEQYAEIMKLLDGCEVQSPSEPVVNMAGTYHSLGIPTYCIIDGGANEHMTGKLMHLSSSKFTATFTKFVKLPNGGRAPVAGIGSVPFTDSITLENVLHMTDFTVNLLSISKFTKNHNCFVTFFPHFCLFQDHRTGRVMGIGKEINGLYHLDTRVFLSTKPISNTKFPLIDNCCNTSVSSSLLSTSHSL
ncbi:uncharacterized protein LOC142544123 [Primulina tabacum]|uniref:uncharacterized protein LOC142544123 n=1 Tax=Primulina tabacum TaxID=48773 RepID=UPI003F5997E2